MEKMNVTTTGKKTHIAAIKLLAIFFVAFIHTGSRGFFLFSVAFDSPLFAVYLFSTVLSKIAVPLFFMCSGALLLGKDEPLKRLYTHRVLKYAIVLVLFSFITYVAKDLSKFDLGYFFQKLYSSNVNGVFWFLYSYLAILILLPFLRKMARALDGKDIIYFIALYLIFVNVIPFLEFVASQRAYKLNINLPLITDNICFVILGYWVENKLDIKRIKPFHLGMGVVASLIAISLAGFMMMYEGRVEGKFSEGTTNSFVSAFIIVPTVVTYVLFKYAYARRGERPKADKVVLYLGDLTFGMYLTHIIFLGWFSPVFNVLYPYIKSLPAATVWFLLALIASGAVTALLKRIPYISKLL